MTLMTSTVLTSKVFFKCFYSWLYLLVLSLLIKISSLLLFPALLVFLAAIYFFRSIACRYLYYPGILSHSPFLVFYSVSRFTWSLASQGSSFWNFRISLRKGHDTCVSALLNDYVQIWIVSLKQLFKKEFFNTHDFENCWGKSYGCEIISLRKISQFHLIFWCGNCAFRKISTVGNKVKLRHFTQCSG